MSSVPVTSATVYFTSICNSGCQTCDIWKEKNRQEFPIEAFEKILDLPWLKDTTWALIGGEFTIYSNYIEVIEALNKRDKEYYFITNGILPNRVKNVYKYTEIKNLSFSLDAYGEEHDRLRGAPHNFRKIKETIEWVKEHHPETKLRITYTLSNLNSREELLKVIQFAKEFDLDLKLGIATSSELFLSHTDEKDIKLTTEELYQFEDLVKADDQYLQLYRAWERGFAPDCDGIAEHLVLMYDGNVMLCENKNLVLGNIQPWENADQNLDKLWHSQRVNLLLEEYRKCNDCWMSCMRKADAKRIDVSNIAKIKEHYGY